jgi:hypothetical protein
MTRCGPVRLLAPPASCSFPSNSIISIPITLSSSAPVVAAAERNPPTDQEIVSDTASDGDGAKGLRRGIGVQCCLGLRSVISHPNGQGRVACRTSKRRWLLAFLSTPPALWPVFRSTWSKRYRRHPIPDGFRVLLSPILIMQSRRSSSSQSLSNGHTGGRPLPPVLGELGIFILEKYSECIFLALRWFTPCNGCCCGHECIRRRFFARSSRW